MELPEFWSQAHSHFVGTPHVVEGTQNGRLLEGFCALAPRRSGRQSMDGHQLDIETARAKKGGRPFHV
jgi:hypothetical protein